jgi:hypothetical protein
MFDYRNPVKILYSIIILSLIVLSTVP